MPSSGYTAITFVANEQPTTAKWNLIGSNDASFNNGNGFEDSIILKRHMGDDAVGAAELDWADLNISFHAHGTGNRSVANNTTFTWLFSNDSTGDAHDSGSVFNTATSMFTAPVNGYYLLVAGGLRIDVPSNNLAQTHINVNGGVVHKISNMQFAGQTVGAGSVFVYMAAGQQAYCTGLQITGGSATAFDQDAYFSGALLFRV